MSKKKVDSSWFRKRHSSHHLPSETFVSDKYDFSPGCWDQTRLDMKVGPAICSLMTNRKARYTKRKKGEPFDDTSCLLLKLQAGLGLEQFEIYKQEAAEAGYTPQEYEREYEHLWGEGTEDDSMEFMSPEEKQLRREELIESKSGSQSLDSRTDFYPDIWPDTDLDMRIRAEKEEGW